MSISDIIGKEAIAENTDAPGAEDIDLAGEFVLTVLELAASLLSESADDIEHDPDAPEIVFVDNQMNTVPREVQECLWDLTKTAYLAGYRAAIQELNDFHDYIKSNDGDNSVSEKNWKEEEK